MNIKVIIIFISVLSLGLCFTSPAFARQKVGQKMAEGNRLYAAGDYDKALTTYNDAQIEAPTAPEIFFNMGNVFFKQGKYQEAIDAYRKSMEKGDVNLEAKALYNIGNALFREGQLREALESYKLSLERNPEDIDTKYNIEYTERMIKEMLSKSKDTKERAQKEQEKRKQEQPEQKNEAGGNEKKEDKEGNEGQQQSQQQAQQQAQPGALEEEKAGEHTGQMGSAGEKQGEGEKAQSAQKEDRELSKEEAERFLSTFERDKKGNPLLNQQQSRKGRGYYVEKDW